MPISVNFLRSRGGLFLAVNLFLAVCLGNLAPAQVLFDATKAEMAGNADWVIDADLHDLSVGSGDGSGTRGGSDSEPQRVPTPAISGITASTAETYWQGGISAFAVALAKRGQTTIETLPVFISTTSTTRSRITYNDSTNAQDLSKYRMFVVCEPNILFTTAEKTAILTWVKNGGSLFMISDHDGADRNNDGYDAVAVWNDLLKTNAVQSNPFGFTFNANDVSPSAPAADTTATNPLTRGAAGTVTSVVFVDGATMTVTDAAVARASVWQTSSKSSSQVMALYGTFGAGRFVAIGDSSVLDDGTGDSGDTLYDGWDSGNDSALVINAAIWLLTPVAVAPTATTAAASTVDVSTATVNASVNPQGQSTSVSFQYGTTTSYGSNTATLGAGSGTSAVSLSAGLSALAYGTTYHYRVVATNATGTTYGADSTFTTANPTPSATTEAAASVTSNMAVLVANLYPNNVALTYHFDFGTTTAYGFSSIEQSIASGAASAGALLQVPGLPASTTFHYRIVITSTYGVAYGGDVAFTTAAFVDTDGDGIPDDYEQSHGLNYRNASDAALDSDGDGQSNLAEYLAGTDPAKATDSLRLTSTKAANGTDVLLSFPTVFAKRYVVERTTNLVSAAWTAVSATINGNGASQSFTDAGATLAAPRYFYRVRILP